MQNIQLARQVYVFIKSKYYIHCQYFRLKYWQYVQKHQIPNRWEREIVLGISYVHTMLFCFETTKMSTASKGKRKCQENQTQQCFFNIERSRKLFEGQTRNHGPYQLCFFHDSISTAQLQRVSTVGSSYTSLPFLYKYLQSFLLPSQQTPIGI